MVDMNSWVDKALECGFSYAAPVDVENLVPTESVRDACAENKCQSYDKNWGCPPATGTLEECGARMQEYKYAILLQTVGEAEDDFDFEYYMETAEKHDENMKRFADALHEQYPEALCLGAGMCTVCPTCAYPEPCRFPEKQMSSMEAYGLYVTGVTRTTELKYYYGEGTVAYAGCCLF